ncbi:MAG: STAS domain-containing protein [Desulfobacterales bacterium]|nr:STAS domain-containing protein [Desulfobacterales bacterium]MDD4071379.1 STAS domain-containing protein [Desulfobacterales bacterium]MDD4391424.1 STAS domain-containing protein [Desulfobacterales bacterium]
MAVQQFSITQDADGTFRFKGEVTIHNIEYLKGFLDTTSARSKKITLDMADVSYVDTASLQLLIAFRKSQKAKAKFEIRNVSRELNTLLEISGLKKFLL